jgi:cell division protein FtsB
MNKQLNLHKDYGIVIRVLICIFVFGLCLYSYIDKQNELTQLRISIPTIVKEIKEIREENTRIQYEINQFESPQHLMELAREQAYKHLKHPLAKEILTLNEGNALHVLSEKKNRTIEVRARPTLAIGAK